MAKKQEIHIAEDKPTIMGFCDKCGKHTNVNWYEGNPKGFGGERKFVGAFCSDSCAEASGKYHVVGE